MCRYFTAFPLRLFSVKYSVHEGVIRTGKRSNRKLLQLFLWKRARSWKVAFYKRVAYFSLNSITCMCVCVIFILHFAVFSCIILCLLLTIAIVIICRRYYRFSSSILLAILFPLICAASTQSHIHTYIHVYICKYININKYQSTLKCFMHVWVIVI